MRIVGFVVVALASIVALAAPARAMNWSLGANLGYALIMPAYDGADALHSFAWPNASEFSPGLRIGFTGESPAHELFVDTALRLLSTDGFSSRGVVATANYQHNFGASGSVAPFLTAGAGVLMTGSEVDLGPPFGTAEESATAAIFGGGIGVRHRMGNGHGTLRGEVRFDRTTEGEDSGSLVIPKANVISVKLGFDLWDR